MNNDEKIKQLILSCFQMGQNGYNESEDKVYYLNEMIKKAYELKLIRIKNKEEKK